MRRQANVPHICLPTLSMSYSKFTLKLQWSPMTVAYVSSMDHAVSVRNKRIEGHHDDACISLDEVAAIYKELGNQGGMVDRFESIGKIKKDQGLHDDVCISLSEAAAICKELDDRVFMALEIGDIKQRQGKYR
ncbi:hypothetical protein FRB95_010121 [Tulasnella sp. JGI-2019a]|nr:hypothetical protein FRB95_010121 [Tulasnella sp. JGI-2019a]